MMDLCSKIIRIKRNRFGGLFIILSIFCACKESNRVVVESRKETVLKAPPKYDPKQKIIFDRYNSDAQQKKPYVILISADGFRYDYAKKYNAITLLQLSSEGVAAESMLPPFPSLTYPGHHTLATGLYPSHHGIVNNRFYDPKRKEVFVRKDRSKLEDGTWYGGTPLWVLAEQQQMLSASFYWVGTEAAIQDIYPTYYYQSDQKIEIDERIQEVVNWLKLPASRRPHLITFHLKEVDKVGHATGPESYPTSMEVGLLDKTIQKLIEAVKKTGLENVNYIFVLDHGMTEIKKDLELPDVIDRTKFIIPSQGTFVALYAKDKADIRPTYESLKQRTTEVPDYEVYLKEDVPSRLNYSAKDDRMNRIGDILLFARWPNSFSAGKTGQHGYDPTEVKDMHATFYAWGPAFKRNVKINSFESVHVYPLITEILGLSYTEQIDGVKGLLSKQILK